MPTISWSRPRRCWPVLCNVLGCTLPTRKMVNQIWTNAAVKLNPQPIPPSGDMVTVPVFAQENYMVQTQRNTFTNSFPLGALVSGDKKDVILSTMIYTNFDNPPITDPVVIYGWLYTTGVPIQPIYNGHENTYADYSHGIRLVNALTVDGNPNTITNVFTNPNLAALLSDEGPSEGTTSAASSLSRTTRYRRWHRRLSSISRAAKPLSPAPAPPTGCWSPATRR